MQKRHPLFQRGIHPISGVLDSLYRQAFRFVVSSGVIPAAHISNSVFESSNAFKWDKEKTMRGRFGLGISLIYTTCLDSGHLCKAAQAEWVSVWWADAIAEIKPSCGESMRFSLPQANMHEYHHLSLAKHIGTAHIAWIIPNTLDN